MKFFLANLDSDASESILIFWHVANMTIFSETTISAISVIGASLSTILLVVSKYLRWKNERLVEEQHKIEIRIKLLQEEKLKNEIASFKKNY